MRAQPTALATVTSSTINRWVERIARVLNRNVSFGASLNNTDQDINLDIWKANGTAPGVANTAFTINHSLGRVPICIVGQVTNNGGLIYGDTSTWTTSQVTLKCTVASSVYRLILA